MSEVTKLDRRFFLAAISGAVAFCAIFKSTQLLSSVTTNNGLISIVDDEFIIVGGWVMLKEDLIG